MSKIEHSVITSGIIKSFDCTRNVTDGRTTDRLWYENNIPYFSNEKAGIIINNNNYTHDFYLEG